MELYVYTRDIDPSTGQYDVNNPLRIDGEDNQIYLINEIKNDPDFIDLNFKLVGDTNIFTIYFSTSLSIDQKNKLDLIVNNHKNNI
jgi:hypothetical protein